MIALLRAGRLLLCGIVLGGCDGPAQQLVGTWESDAGGRLNHLDLRADGSLTGTLQQVDFAGNKTSVGIYSGSWRFKRGHLDLLINESNVANLAPGYASSDEIVELSDQVLLLRSATQHEESWQRVP